MKNQYTLSGPQKGTHILDTESGQLMNVRNGHYEDAAVPLSTLGKALSNIDKVSKDHRIGESGAVYVRNRFNGP